MHADLFTLPRLIGVAGAILFAIWLAGPAEAMAAKCGGRKADIVGTKGDDVIKTDKGGVQVIHGLGGDDKIVAKRNKDIVCGGSGKAWAGGGADVMIGGGGGDRFRGGAGDDRLFGEIQDDKLYGDSGNDLLVGGQGIDRLQAGVGDDWIRGDTNQDKYFGDAGTDTISYATATPPGPKPDQDGVTVNLAAGYALGDDSQEGTLTGVENVIGSAFEDILIGTGGGFVRGNGGGDTCSGFASTACGDVPAAPVAFVADADGPDPGVMVIGGPAADSLTISESGNTIQVGGTAINPGQGCTANGAGVSCAGGASEFGYILLYGDSGNDTLNIGGGLAASTGVKGDGGIGDDTLNGGPAGDTLFPGESGSDRLFGGGGDDALAGRPGGGDLLVGGPGNDNLATDDACAGHTYVGGGGGADVAGFAQAGEGAGVRAALGGTAVRLGAGGCSPTRVGNDLEVLEGTRNNDFLVGNSGIDLVIGREGNDNLDGRAGRDELRGDGGNDSCPDNTAIKLSC